MRKSLANKKAAATATLSKQDQALIQAQLEKEVIIRQRVNDIKAKLEQGLHLVRSLVLARVEQLRTFVSPLATLLREGAFGKAVTLVGHVSFETYIVSQPAIARTTILTTRAAALRVHFGPPGYLQEVGWCGESP